MFRKSITFVSPLARYSGERGRGEGLDALAGLQNHHVHRPVQKVAFRTLKTPSKIAELQFKPRLDSNAWLIVCVWPAGIPTLLLHGINILANIDVRFWLVPFVAELASLLFVYYFCLHPNNNDIQVFRIT